MNKCCDNSMENILGCDDSLKRILECQNQFASRWTPFDKLNLREKEKWTKEYIIMMYSEVAELLREINFKMHRKKRKKVKVTSIIEEMIDILCFWSNIALCWGFTHTDLVEAYHKKLKKNYTRLKRKL